MVPLAPTFPLALCVPGNHVEVTPGPFGFTAESHCAKFENLGQTFVEVPNGVTELRLHSHGYSWVRLAVIMAAPAVTGDIVVQCTNSAVFAEPPEVLVRIDNPTLIDTPIASAWTAINPACENPTLGVGVQAGMQDGNGAEDPIIRLLRV